MGLDRWTWLHPYMALKSSASPHSSCLKCFCHSQFYFSIKKQSTIPAPPKGASQSPQKSAGGPFQAPGSRSAHPTAEQ